MHDRRHLPTVGIGAGICLYLAYVLRIGRDFLQGRFLSVPVLAAAFLVGRRARLLDAPQLAGGTVLLLGVLAQPPNLFSNGNFYLALSDPFLARQCVPRNKSWHAGHFPREVPDGYVETLKTGANQLEDPELAAFYEDIRLIVRGRRLSSERWQAIWHTNLGINWPACPRGQRHLSSRRRPACVSGNLPRIS